MSEIIYGLYEQIINGVINENLNKVDQQLIIKDTQPLDSAEYCKTLAEYSAELVVPQRFLDPTRNDNK